MGLALLLLALILKLRIIALMTSMLITERNEIVKKLKVGDAVRVVFSRNAENKGYFLSLMAYTASLDNPANCFVEGKIVDKKKAHGSYNATIEVTNTTNCESSTSQGKSITRGQTVLTT